MMAVIEFCAGVAAESGVEGLAAAAGAWGAGVSLDATGPEPGEAGTGAVGAVFSKAAGCVELAVGVAMAEVDVGVEPCCSGADAGGELAVMVVVAAMEGVAAGGAEGALPGMGMAVGTSVLECPGIGIAMGGVEGFDAGALSVAEGVLVLAKSDGAPIVGAAVVSAASLAAGSSEAGAVAIEVFSFPLAEVSSDRLPCRAVKNHTAKATSKSRKRIAPRI